MKKICGIYKITSPLMPCYENVKKALLCNKIFKIRCISHLCTPKLVQHRAKTERNRAANSFACIASTNQSERAGTVALLSPAFFISHNGGDWRSKSLTLPLMVSTIFDGFYFANCVLAAGFFLFDYQYFRK